MINFPFNTDYSKRIVIDSSSWDKTLSFEEGKKIDYLEAENKNLGSYTAIVTYESKSQFFIGNSEHGEEFFLLDGSMTIADAEYQRGTYFRRAGKKSISVFTREGCKFFIKKNYYTSSTFENITLNTSNEEWLPGQGGLKVMPLASGPSGSTLVKWPANEKFVTHKHFGGEEILVLDGTFIDEHGSYPKWTWVRSPHMSEHHPFVREDCVIFVKVGHLKY